MAEKYPLVCVYWLDAHGSAVGTYEIDEIPHAAILVKSYGLLLKEDEKGVSIASEQCDEGVFRGFTFVPKGMIVKIEPVKKVRKRKIETTPSIPSPSPITGDSTSHSKT